MYEYHVDRKYVPVFFAWFNAMPDIVRILQGCNWRENHLGYWFTMPSRKYDELMALCKEFEENA